MENLFLLKSLIKNFAVQTRDSRVSIGNSINQKQQKNENPNQILPYALLHILPV